MPVFSSDNSVFVVTVSESTAQGTLQHVIFLALEMEPKSVEAIGDRIFII